MMLDTVTSKSKDRLKFFVLSYIIFALISVILRMALLTTVAFIEYPNMDWLDFFFGEGLFRMAQSTSQMDVLIYLFFASYYSKTDVLRNGNYSLTQLFKSISASTWGIFVLAHVLITALSFFLNYDTFYGNYFPGTDRLNLFLDQSMRGGLKRWYTDLTMRIVSLLPYLITGYVFLKARNSKISFKEMLKEWHRIVVLIVIILLSSVLLTQVVSLISGVVLSLISLPFTEVYIPLLFSILIVVFLGALLFMVQSYGVFFSFNSDVEFKERPIEFEDNDLLDQ